MRKGSNQNAFKLKIEKICEMFFFFSVWSSALYTIQKYVSFGAF